MASKVAKKAGSQELSNQNGAVEEIDIPLMELSKSNPSLKRLIARGKERGYITYDELNEALPQNLLSADQIDESNDDDCRNGQSPLLIAMMLMKHWWKLLLPAN